MSLEAKMAMVQERNFADGALPLTTELGCLPHVKDLVESLLPPAPSGWSFEDRLAVWLEPDLRPPAEAFIERTGPKLLKLLGPWRCRTLDGQLLVRLCARLEREQRGLLAVLKAAPVSHG